MKTYGGTLYPQVKQVLSSLKKDHRLFIVSNCLAGYIENFLESHQLGELFSDHECSGATGRPKGENIASVILRNELKSPVYIGDTIGDLNAAMENDLPFIYASYGLGDVSNCSYTIDNFSEFPTVIREIELMLNNAQ